MTPIKARYRSRVRRLYKGCVPPAIRLLFSVSFQIIWRRFFHDIWRSGAGAAPVISQPVTSRHKSVTTISWKIARHLSWKVTR